MSGWRLAITGWTASPSFPSASSSSCLRTSNTQCLLTNDRTVVSHIPHHPTYTCVPINRCPCWLTAGQQYPVLDMLSQMAFNERLSYCWEPVSHITMKLKYMNYLCTALGQYETVFKHSPLHSMVTLKPRLGVSQWCGWVLMSNSILSDDNGKQKFSPFTVFLWIFLIKLLYGLHHPSVCQKVQVSKCEWQLIIRDKRDVTKLKNFRIRQTRTVNLLVVE